MTPITKPRAVFPVLSGANAPPGPRSKPIGGGGPDGTRGEGVRYTVTCGLGSGGGGAGGRRTRCGAGVAIASGGGGRGPGAGVSSTGRAFAGSGPSSRN